MPNGTGADNAGACTGAQLSATGDGPLLPATGPTSRRTPRSRRIGAPGRRRRAALWHSRSHRHALRTARLPRTGMDRDERHAPAARHRSRRDQDRDRRARPGRPRAAAAAGSDAARRLSCDARAVARPRRAMPSASSARSGTVGIGTPGSISRATGLLRGSNSVCLNGQPIRRDLEATLGREVRITNDANCFALSEASDGAGRAPASSSASSWAPASAPASSCAAKCSTDRMPSPANGATTRCRGRRDDERPGPPCFCGRSGCIETWLSGPGIERDHLARHRRARDGAGHRRARGRRRRGVRRDARALRGAIRPGDRARDQYPRSRRHRAGGRDVERRSALRERAEAVGPLGVLRPRRHAARAQRARRFERRARRGVAVGLRLRR